MQIDPLGDSAVIVRLEEPAAPSLEATDAVLVALAQLRASRINGVVELAPAYTTLGVFYDATLISFDDLRDEIAAALARKIQDVPHPREREAVVIPVCYEKDFAPDLADVAKQSGIAAEEVIRLHASAEYRVGCIGFTPGFPYLLGLPSQLATPRRAVPRREVAAGSVAIGGAQTGIYPTASPGGWNVIGCTPLRLFDVTRPEPSLLRAGDVVRFRRITRAEFAS
jgi:inhibitor of KinA